MVKVPCPTCGQILNVPEVHLDKSGNCRHCGNHIVLRRPVYLAAIDFETTGLDASCHDIIEVAGVLFEPSTGSVASRFCELAMPNVAISRKASAVHGISKKSLKDCRPSQVVLSDFFLWLSQANYIVAHNASFEARFLLQSALRYNLALPDIQVLDTLQLARQLIPTARDHKLGTLLSAINVYEGELHRAEADAEGVRRLTIHLLRQLNGHVPSLEQQAKTLTLMAGNSTGSRPNAALGDGLPTSRQVNYLRALGASPQQISGLTKSTASDLIQELKERGSSTAARPNAPGGKEPQGCAGAAILAISLAAVTSLCVILGFG